MTRSEELNARLAQQSAELNRAFQALTSLNSLWVSLSSMSMCAHHLTSAINFRSFCGTFPHCVELGWVGISGTSRCYQALRTVYCKYVKRIPTLCFHSVQNLWMLIKAHIRMGLDHWVHKLLTFLWLQMYTFCNVHATSKSSMKCLQ